MILENYQMNDTKAILRQFYGIFKFLSNFHAVFFCIISLISCFFYSIICSSQQLLRSMTSNVILFECQLSLSGDPVY
jgi:hypothetical protein